MEAEERNAAEAARVAASEDERGGEEVLDAEVVDDAPGADEAAVVEADLDELGVTRKERDEYLELAQRTKADFENYRRRAAGDIEAARVRGRAELAARLIPAIDNLERALTAGGATEGSELTKGVAMVHADLNESLKLAGVEAYDPLGQRFDPAWHEALATRAEEGTEPGAVIETLEKGYRLDGQVLRPARVVVSE
jgi:molecular chaperone GrpE